VLLSFPFLDSDYAVVSFHTAFFNPITSRCFYQLK